MIDHPPNDALFAVGNVRDFLLLRFPFKQFHQRLVHCSEGISRFMQTAASEVLAVGAERHTADSAVIDRLSTVVGV